MLSLHTACDRGQRLTAMQRRRGLKLIVVAVALVVIGAAALVQWYRAATRPVATSGEPVLVEIERGSGASVIARQLEAAGLIRSAAAFEVLLSLSGEAGSLRAGQYELSPEMDAAQIARKLAAGEVAVRRVTIPEGLRIEEIAERIAEAGLTSADEFLEAATPSQVMEQSRPDGLKLDGDSLEGYLFPETYDFELGSEPSAMAARMVRELNERFVKPNKQRIAASKLSLHEIITLASLVEREARVAQERPPIAGVLMNRLNRDMPLQCDATIQYALGAHRERLLYEDLKVDSPYNTYLHKGLPPGPICAPGLESLLAALSPAETDSLYYVARPDGKHVFSKTYEEHQAAIRRVRSQ